MDISFIGSGNLAWHLAPAFDNAGHIVREVYSRDKRHATALTERLYQAVVHKDLDFSQSRSRIFIIAVSDDAIRDVATEVVLPDEALLVHTSGSQPLTLLQFAAATNLGVFYPLQTFSRTKKIDFRTVPIFIEPWNDEGEKTLMTLGKAISDNVRKISSEERRLLHLAAVFASNFTNHMLTLSKDLMERNNLNFELLKPLILETVNKSLSVGPEEAQTGPARRGDMEILDGHVELLQDNERLANIYKMISQHILDRYQTGENR